MSIISCVTVPAGTMTQTARGGFRRATRSAIDVVPTAPCPSASRTFSGLRLYTTTRWPPCTRRTTMFMPMRPRPMNPSSIRGVLRGTSRDGETAGERWSAVSGRPGLRCVGRTRTAPPSATRTRSAVPRKKPVSTTPGTRRMSRSSAAASSWAAIPQSRIQLPLSVTNGAGARLPQDGLAAERAEPAVAERPRERHDLHRQAAPGAEARHELLGGDEDDLAPRGGGDDPLPRERPAVALDEVEPRVDLIGAVDRDVERVRRQLGDGEAERPRERRDRPRGGDPLDDRAPELPRRPAPARTLPRRGRSRARRGRSGPPREPARRPGPPGGRDRPDVADAGRAVGSGTRRPDLASSESGEALVRPHPRA